MTDDELNEDTTRSRLDLGLWRRILAHARPYRRPLAALALSGIIMAGADSLLPRVTGWIIDDATSGEAAGSFPLHIALYAILVISISGLIWFFIVMAGRVVTGYAYDVRRAGFARLQELSFSFYDQRPVGWLMARLTSDCSRLASIIPWTLLDMVWGTSFIAGISIMMLLLNWRLGLLVMLIVPPMAVVSIIFQRKLLKSQRRVRKINSRITASYNEGIMGVRTTKALVREGENLKEFQGLSDDMYRQSIRNLILAAAYLPIVLSIGSAGVGLALWRGGMSVGAGMSLGTLIAFMQYAALFYIPIQEMAERFTQFQAAQASAERLQGLLDTEPEIQDSPEVIAALEAQESAARGAGSAGATAGAQRIASIEFDRVSFSYKEGEPILVDFDLRVEAGETIALVGATGSGKSTIVSLLSRFYEPTRGAIRVNGTDYRRLGLMWLQSNLGIVLQSPHLFSGTIRDNIRYGRLDASDDEVAAAARLVNADTFISALDDGYDTEVGEAGSRLSTGQKQFVSLARAVLADPQIFIMDEATSSVDTETERLIQAGIEKILRGRISFIIAHRLSTVRAADRILVIDHGRILEEGNHRRLIALRGRYHHLYTNQFSRESQERILESAEPPPGG
ncbi:MAG: ABC transporter ATP-binding protein [Planctomycetota bacterium]